MLEPIFRPTRHGDLAATYAVRASTRDNPIPETRLLEQGITPETVWSGYMRGDYIGWVSEVGGEVIGFCTGDAATGEVLVLALLPEHERKGIGARLLALVIKGMRAKGSPRLWLAASSDPRVRAHGFYRAKGWVPTGEILENGDEILAFKAEEGWES
ncbi:MAG: GNAT family N-acetyltransferase [Fibrobacteria bacterium]